MSLDLLKFDFTKIDLKTFRNVKTITIAVLIAIFIVDVLIILPITKNIQEAQKEHGLSWDEFGRANKILLKEKTGSKSLLLSMENVEEFIDTVKDLAKKNSVEATLNTTLGKSRYNDKENPYLRKTLHVDIVGEFKNTGAFLNALHQMPEAMLEVDSLNVGRDPKNPTQIKTQVNYLVYVLKDEDNQ